MSVYWATLCERAGAANDQCYNAMIDVAMETGKQGYSRLAGGYTRTDFSRNSLVDKFMGLSTRDNDLLVMLDGDHKHPADIVTRFAAHDPQHGVVGALAYRRGEPYDPLFFIRQDRGLFPISGFELGPTYQCAVVSTSAISIRRWVFLELAHKGYLAPYFRYEYPTGGLQPSEDMYFGRQCEQAGIWHYCDTSIIIPHATNAWVDEKVHETYLANHPELTTGATNIQVNVA